MIAQWTVGRILCPPPTAHFLTMLAIERKHRILAILRQRKSATLEALAEEVGVSSSTVRRDIDTLAQAGEVEKTHGGVLLIEKPSSSRPYAFDQRLEYNLDPKRRIAIEARKLVEPGQTILIDGGTTTFYFAEQLRGIHLQIVTNSLPIAELYQNDENVELILTGGLVYPRYGVLLGPMTEAAISSIHTQTLFLSVAGLRDGQLYNQNLLLVQAEQKMIQQSQQVVLLCDSGKFGQQALAKLGDLSMVDIVVTDSGADENAVADLKNAGIRVIVAE